ncbi:MAG: DUF1848 domain-containing protein [Clostridia bacterium]|nr:DUF1848 domain-containing protein [Clostridia bacterium]
MKIGITERGDAGIDFSWVDKVPDMNLTILVTKNLNIKFRDHVMLQHTLGRRLVVHATCTGWGGTFMEPNVPEYQAQLGNLRELIDAGFPKAQCVLRIDPIIPASFDGIDGIDQARKVIAYARELGLLPGMRVRVSVVDEYRHVKDRLKKMGFGTIYPNDAKYAKSEQMAKVRDLCLENPDVTFESCAEPYLKARNVTATGCVSEKDLSLFGLTPDTDNLNPQNRYGCLCLAGKHELLTNKRQCPHKCAYCYWRS